MANLDFGPATLDITLYRGDDSTVKITIDDGTDPLELPTLGWLSQIRTTRAATDVVDTITVDATQAATGILFLVFPDDLAVGSFVYDVQCSTGGVRTYLAGSLRVSRDVSRA